MQIRSQIYSEKAFKYVNELAVLQKQKDENKAKIARRYKSLCKRAGGIFRTVGLVQFTTFIEAKGKKDKDKHYRYLSEHLQKELNELSFVKCGDTSECLKKIRHLSLSEYMQVSQIVLQLLMWHKRMAEILIEGEDDSQTDKGG